MITSPLRFYLMFLVICLACSTCGLFANGSGAGGGGGKSKPPPPPEDKRVLVTAVNLANKQITLVTKIDGLKRIYNVDDFTQVTFENNPGSFKDITAGQEAFSYIERDGQTLDSITVGRADPPPAPPKKAAKGQKQ